MIVLEVKHGYIRRVYIIVELIRGNSATALPDILPQAEVYKHHIVLDYKALLASNY